jgi:hypothetical protein
MKQLIQSFQKHVQKNMKNKPKPDSEEIKALKRQFASLITKEDMMLVINMLRFKANQGNKKAKKLLLDYIAKENARKTALEVRHSILHPKPRAGMFDSPD